jgi:hypothetical protein
MATANISSTFDITLAGGDFNVAKTFTAPRGFTVVGCTATNTAGPAGTLILAGATAGTFSATAAGIAGTGIVQAQAVGGPDMSVGIFAANATITAGEVITVTASTTTISPIILHCVASGGGQAITVA